MRIRITAVLLWAAIVAESLNPIAGNTQECPDVSDWTQPYVTDDCTLGLWHADDATTSLLADASVNHNDGIVYGPTRAASQTGFGDALVFGDGDSVKIDLHNSTFITGSHTVEAWIYPTSIGTQQTILSLYGVGDQIPLYLNADGRVSFRLVNSAHLSPQTQVYSQTVLHANAGWYHIAASWDDATHLLAIFVNGIKESEVSVAWSPTPLHSTNLDIGKLWTAQTVPNGAASFFHGYIDEVRVSRTARVFSQPAYVCPGESDWAHAYVTDDCTMALWHLDDSGTQAEDTSGRGHDGSLASAAGWTTGRFGGGLTGSAEHVLVPNHPDLNLQNGPFTIECWAKHTGNPGGYRYLIHKRINKAGTDNGQYALYTGSSGGLTFFVSRAGDGAIIRVDHSDPASVWDGTWHHIAGVYDGAQLLLYVDGDTAATTSFSGQLYSSSMYPLGVGDISSTTTPATPHNFPGVIDEVRVSRVGRAFHAPARTDIVVSEVNGHYCVVPGEKNVILTTVRNLGPSDVRNMVLYCYLSADDILDPSERTGFSITPILSAGARADIAIDIHVPSTLPVWENYRWYVSVEYFEDAVDTNPENNVSGEASPWRGSGAITVPRRPIVFIPGLMGSHLLGIGEVSWTGIPPTNKVHSYDFGGLDGTEIDWDQREMWLRCTTPDQSGNDWYLLMENQVVGENVVPRYTQIGLGPTYPNEVRFSLQDGNLFSRIDSKENMYLGLIARLDSWDNVQKGSNLFGFPYDWRQSNLKNASLLEDILSEVVGSKGRVDIIAHSMGGLIARNLGYANPNRVDHLVLVGSPQLGAPEAAIHTTFGKSKDFGPLGVCEILPARYVRHLTRNYRPVYELLPKQGYFSFLESLEPTFPFFHLSRDDGLTTDIASHSDLVTLLLSGVPGLYQPYEHSELLLDTQSEVNTLHAADLRDVADRVFVIAGIYVGTYAAGWEPTDAAYNVSIKKGKPHVETEHVYGDGTVPLFSAAGDVWSATWGGLVDESNTFLVAGGSHAKLCQHYLIQSVIEYIFQGGDDPTEHPSVFHRPPSGRGVGFDHEVRVTTASPVRLTLFDQTGGRTGLFEGKIEEMEQTKYHEYEFNDQVSVFDSGHYTLVITGVDSSVFGLDIKTLDSLKVSSRRGVRNIPSLPGTKALMAIAGGKIQDSLVIDFEGDGVWDTTLISSPWINEQYGNIRVTVLSERAGLLGVTVTLYDDSGNWVTSANTDEDGECIFLEVENGNYSVSIVSPLGFKVEQEAVEVQVSSLQHELGFVLTMAQGDSQQRSHGYWVNRLHKALRGRPKEYTTDDFSRFAGLIAQHFNSNLLYSVDVYRVPQPATQSDSLEALYDLLKGGLACRDYEEKHRNKAKSQLAALLLNVASGKLSHQEIASEDGVTVSQAITYANYLISSDSLCNGTGVDDSDHNNGDDDNQPNNKACCELAKEIAEVINEGEMLDDGLVPLDIANIAYKGASITHEGAPLRFELSQNFPNPFNAGTVINYSLTQDEHVRLEVFDILGRRVALLIDQLQAAGRHSVSWDGRDSGGDPVASGMYFYRLLSDSRVESRKMVLVK